MRRYITSKKEEALSNLREEFDALEKSIKTINSRMNTLKSAARRLGSFSPESTDPMIQLAITREVLVLNKMANELEAALIPLRERRDELFLPTRTEEEMERLIESNIDYTEDEEELV